MRRKAYERNRRLMPGFKQKSIKKRKVSIMDTHDRDIMTKDLMSLGLNEQLLNNLSNDVINQLFQLIGWASNVQIITEAQENKWEMGTDEEALREMDEEKEK